MNDIAEALQTAFTPPPPKGKRAFLQQHIASALPVHRVLLTQLRYIRCHVWLAAAFVLCAGILSALVLSRQTVAVLSALTPLPALTLVTECGRSERWGMAELELSTRLSLRTLVLARLCILGCCSGVLLIALLPIALWGNSVAPITAGLYITTPFLLNCFAGLWIVRHFQGSEGMFGCAGVTACIMCMPPLSRLWYPALYGEALLHLWGLAALLLTIGIAKQCCATLKQKEELQWS